MASQSPTQLTLFETIQTANADGSFTLRPKRVSDMREIGAARAAAILGVHVETVYRLCELGEEAGGLRAWKLPSLRGNAKWRISWESAAGFRQRRERQMRAC